MERKKKMNRKRIKSQWRKSLSLFLQIEFAIILCGKFCQSAKASKNTHDILCIYGAGMKEKSKCSETITSEFQTVRIIS
jgi:hypothetical protein